MLEVAFSVAGTVFFLIAAVYYGMLIYGTLLERRAQDALVNILREQGMGVIVQKCPHKPKMDA